MECTVLQQVTGPQHKRCTRAPGRAGGRAASQQPTRPHPHKPTTTHPPSCLPPHCSDFPTREMLLDALCASCWLPWYSGEL